MTSTPGRRERYWIFVLLFTLSGFSGLVYEVVWARKLQLAFGVTAFAVSSVLAAYFLGLAVGSALGGVYSDRLRRPLLAYGLVEIAIGLLAVVITPWLDRLDVVLRPFHTVLEGHFWGLQGARFLLTLGALLVPTTLLGMTVPLISRGVVSRVGEVGNRIALLYSANTFGAVIGVVVAGFLLIETVGLRLTIWLAAALSVGVGTCAVLLQRTIRSRDESARVDEVPHDAAAPSPQVGHRTVLYVMAISGAMGLGLEVIWTRVLIQNFVATSYVFSTVLATFLVGIALGSYVVRRRIDAWSNLVARLAFCEAAIGMLTVLGMVILDRLMPLVVPAALRLIGLDPEAHFFLTWTVWSASALLPVAILLGATFPLAARIIATRDETIGSGIGRLYAVNTIGGVVGVIAVGFFLIPRLGLHATFLTIAAVQVGLLLILAASGRGDWKGMAIYVGPPVTMAIIAGLIVPGDLVRARMLAGIHGKVLEYREDYYGSIVLSEETQGGQKYKRLSVNGVSYSGTAPYAKRYMRLQGHLPMIMHPGQPRRELVICFGVGLTAGAISIYPGADLTVVELSKAVLELSPRFRDVNEGVSQSPHCRLVIDDGRNYLLRNPTARFDVITLEPPPPSQVGMANLYSKEFYELARRRLTVDGVMAQWIPLHTQSDADTKMLLATFIDVFPNASLWWTEAGETLVLGYHGDPSSSRAMLTAAFHNPQVTRSLAEIGIHSPLDLASGYLLDGPGLRRYVGDAPVMSDDLPLIEYRVPRINRGYKATLRRMLMDRPAAAVIAENVGLARPRTGALREALLSRARAWMATRLYEGEEAGLVD